MSKSQTIDYSIAIDIFPATTLTAPLAVHAMWRAPRSMQVDGLSGHLPRFWSDIMNSTWLYPEHRWRETFSDRGGNLPYWLNGVIPLVAQLPHVSLSYWLQLACRLCKCYLRIKSRRCYRRFCVVSQIFVTYHDAQYTNACVHEKYSLVMYVQKMGHTISHARI